MTEAKTKIPMVITRLAEVMSQLVGLEKNKQAPERAGGFMYRGIDDLLDTLHPLLVDAQLLISPKVVHHTVQFHDERNTPYMAEVLVEYEFLSIEDGSTKTIGPVLGTGTDNLDKMAGKAMTSAFKIAMYQAFCVPVGEAIDIEATADDNSPTPAKIPTPAPIQKQYPPPTQEELDTDDRHRRELVDIINKISQGDKEIGKALLIRWTEFEGKNGLVKGIDTLRGEGGKGWNLRFKGMRLSVALSKARAELKELDAVMAISGVTPEEEQQITDMEGAANG